MLKKNWFDEPNKAWTMHDVLDQVYRYFVWIGMEEVEVCKEKHTMGFHWADDHRKLKCVAGQDLYVNMMFRSRKTVTMRQAFTYLSFRRYARFCDQNLHVMTHVQDNDYDPKFIQETIDNWEAIWDFEEDEDRDYEIGRYDDLKDDWNNVKIEEMGTKKVSDNWDENETVKEVVKDKVYGPGDVTKMSKKDYEDADMTIEDEPESHRNGDI